MSCNTEAGKESFYSHVLMVVMGAVAAAVISTSLVGVPRIKV